MAISPIAITSAIATPVGFLPWFSRLPVLTANSPRMTSWQRTSNVSSPAASAGQISERIRRRVK